MKMVVHEHAQDVPCERNMEYNCWNRGNVIVYRSTSLTHGWVSSLTNLPNVKLLQNVDVDYRKVCTLILLKTNRNVIVILKYPKSLNKFLDPMFFYS